MRHSWIVMTSIGVAAVAAETMPCSSGSGYFEVTGRSADTGGAARTHIGA
jgi:hypothetical protein